MDKIINILNKNIDKSILDYFCIHIFDSCNLNCAYCDHFSPLIDNSEPISLNLFKKLMMQMFSIFNDDVGSIGLLGGEPLLNDNILEYCHITRSIFKYTSIDIRTNGILLEHKDDDFYRNLSEMNIRIYLTKYPIKYNFEYIFAMCDKYNVKIKVKKSKLANINLNITSENNNLIHYLNCTNGKYDGDCSCFQLNSDGNLYFCTIPANINIFNDYFSYKFITEKGKDYDNIFENLDKNFYIENSIKPLSFCKYCKTKTQDKNKKWKISEKNIYEWIEKC